MYTTPEAWNQKKITPKRLRNKQIHLRAQTAILDTKYTCSIPY